MLGLRHTIVVSVAGANLLLDQCHYEAALEKDH